MREKGAHLRYVGRDVRAVPGIGVFQHGTVAFVPRAQALELLAGDDFEVAGDPKPATQIVFRVGQVGPQKRAEPGEAAEAGAGAPQ